MFSRAVRVARIGGIEVRLDPSLLLLALLVAWAFSTRFRAGHGLTTALVMAGVGALLVLLTTLAHELAHALEARHRGIEVEGITLFLFGGVTEMHAHGQTARDELAVAVVGPWISLVCGAAFGLLATFAPEVLPAAAAAPVAEVAGLLGWWNVLIAVFNLVPGAPLDGGRVLRALLWMVLGDRLRGLRVAVRAGQTLAILLVAGGVVLGVAGWRVTGSLEGWLPATAFALVGIFLFNAARSELKHAEMDALLTGRTVVELVGRPRPPVPAATPLELVDTDAIAGDLVTVADGDHVVGLIERTTLADTHPIDRAARTAGEVAEALGQVPTVDLHDDLHTMIDRFQGDHHVVGVTDAGQLVGALTEREVARALDHLRRTGQVTDRTTAEDVHGHTAGEVHG